MRKSPNIEISELDLGQIFSDDHEITGNRIPKILQIPLDMIDEFPDHPFQVRDDEDMMHLVESVGTGIPRIARILSEDGFPPAEYKTEGFFTTTQWKKKSVSSEQAGENKEKNQEIIQTRI